jgi:hypothetical protein
MSIHDRGRCRLKSHHRGRRSASRLSVRTLAVQEGGMPEWYVASEGETRKELEWPVEQPSAAVLTTAGTELLLLSKETNANGEVEFKAARKLTVPEGRNDVLLVAWPDDEDPKVGLMLVADDVKQAMFNDWLVINTSKQVVTLRYGTKSEPIQLEPHESKAYRIDAEHNQGGAVSAQMMKKGERKPIYSTYWAAPQNQRSLVVFHDKDSRVKPHRVIDLLPTTPGK